MCESLEVVSKWLVLLNPKAAKKINPRKTSKKWRRFPHSKEQRRDQKFDDSPPWDAKSAE